MSEDAKPEETKPEAVKPAEKEKPRLVTETDITKYKASVQCDCVDLASNRKTEID